MKRKIILEKIEFILDLLNELDKSLLSTEDYQINLLSELDLEVACDLEKRCHAIEPSSGVSFEEDEAFKNLVKINTEMMLNGEILTLKKEDTYLGHIGFKIDRGDQSIGVISFLSVEPSFQGKKFLIPLLIAAIHRLKEKKCKFVKASTSNYKLISFMERLGISHKENVEYHYN